MSPVSSAARRGLAIVLLFATTLFLLDCHSWRLTNPSDVQTLKGRQHEQLRLTYAEGTVVLTDQWTLQYPLVIGTVEKRTGNVEGAAVPGSLSLRAFDLEKAQKIEVLHVSGAKTAGTIIGGAVVVLLLLVAASCPYVYVDGKRGSELAGEAYPGAIFRSIQRDDLLGLPPLDQGEVNLTLSNETYETQFTDRAELLTVDHQPDQQAIATNDGRILLIGSGTPAMRAEDLAGHDVTTDLASDDAAIWSTHLDAVLTSSKNAPSREGIVASFRAPEPGDYVLDVAAENTLWLEVAFYRVFSMMGRSFDRLIASGNESTKPGDIHQWRERQGVDLRVELLGERPTTLPGISAPGMAMLRHVAVPLPRAALHNDIRVRLSGGLGFWRIGSIRLVKVVNAAPQVTRLAPTRATSSTDGSDLRDVLRTSDGRYSRLVGIGENFRLSFTPPPLDAGRVRTAFLSTRGYYNPHRPAAGRPSLLTLKHIRDEEGGLVRYASAFYRENRALFQQPLPQ